MMTDKESTDASHEQETTVSGKAYNAKAGAVLMIDDDTPVYIEGMEEWDDDLIGKKVKLTGVLRPKQIYPEIHNEGGIISQGMSGTPMVLKLTQPFKK
jgi:hypothetical protein